MLDLAGPTYKTRRTANRTEVSRSLSPDSYGMPLKFPATCYKR